MVFSVSADDALSLDESIDWKMRTKKNADQPRFFLGDDEKEPD
jgi:hypothetical protein